LLLYYLVWLSKVIKNFYLNFNTFAIQKLR